MVEGTNVRTSQSVQGRGEQDVDHSLAHPQPIKDVQRGRLPRRRVITILGSALGLLGDSDELAQQLQLLHSTRLGTLMSLPTLIDAISAALHTGLHQVGQVQESRGDVFTVAAAVVPNLPTRHHRRGVRRSPRPVLREDGRSSWSSR